MKRLVPHLEQIHDLGAREAECLLACPSTCLYSPGVHAICGTAFQWNLPSLQGHACKRRLEFPPPRKERTKDGAKCRLTPSFLIY